MSSSSSSILKYVSSDSTPQMTNNIVSEESSDGNYQLDNENNRRIIKLNRQVLVLDDNWIRKNQSKFIQSTNQGEATVLETEHNQHLTVSEFI